MSENDPKSDARDDVLLGHGPAPSDEALVERHVQRVMREMDLSCDADDLRAWGHQGLLEARRRFDETRGVRFAAFAHYRIRGAIIDGIRKQSWMGRRAYAKLKAVEAADRLAEPLGESIAQTKALGADERTRLIHDTLASISAAYVLAAVGQEEESPRATPETLFTDAEAKASVMTALTSLPEKERALLTSIYFEDSTIEQAGAQLGLSKSWASRLHAKALARLKEALHEPDT